MTGLNDQIYRFRRRVFEASHNAHVADWEAGSRDYDLVLSILLPLIVELDAAAAECRNIVETIKNGGGSC